MELRAGPARALVDLDGGRLASLTIDGVELLVTDGERPTRWGSFPMVPWCGRLRDGRLTFDGSTTQFPLTSPPHANHGFGHVVRWEPSGDGAIQTTLGGAEGPGAAWPFGGRVVQRFDLAADVLTVSIEVHADEVPMPAMAGWHPWFRRDLGVGGTAELDLRGGQVYAVGDDGIPTGELLPVPPGPWDACFVGLDADPVVRWPGALDLTVSSTFAALPEQHWVIFTEPEHALCVEPQTGAPNDINRVPRVVRPGEPLMGSMALSWLHQG